MTTAREIIKKSLQKIGVLIKNEEPSSDEASDGLFALNGLVDSWGNDPSVITSRVLESFPLTSGVSTYTMGIGGAFNTVRPINIVQAYVRLSNIDTPVNIISEEAYNSISFKDLSGVPQFLNFNNAYPTENLKLYPAPASGYTLFLLSEKPAIGFATLDTDVSLPAGWERALVYNLALELAPEYAQQPNASIVDTAQKSLGAIRLSTIRARPMDAYPQNLTIRNIYSGWRN